MLAITCPNCGERNSDEFRYGGDASVVRPAHDDPSEEAWFRYVYIRQNPKGPHREYWQHAGGCRSWLIVERDTSNHVVLGVQRAGEPK
jgi:methylglutamate dehydrogenase subunit B